MKNAIKDIKLEYYSINEDVVLSWKYESDKQTYMQKTYRICVTNDEDIIFDTGTIKSRKSTNVHITPKLEYEKEYDVILCVETTDNEIFVSCAKFETEIEKFKSNFLSPDVSPFPDTFELNARIDLTNASKVRMYMSALGVYALYVNGKRVEEFLLAPGWTTYPKMLQYQTYDLLKYSGNGICELKIIVGRGWFRGKLGYTLKNNNYGSESAVISEIHVFDENGKKKILKDDIWAITSSLVVSNDLFDGETKDFNLEKVEYPVKKYKYPKSALINQVGENVVKIARFSPISKDIRDDGKIIFDFGYNITGYIELKLKKGKKGQKITLRHAEVLNKDGTLYTENLRSAKATDTYILDGKSLVLSPLFTFHGYRYAELSGVDYDDVEKIETIEISSNLKRTGYIETNDKSINILIDNVLRSNRGNFVDVPTDCPQRDERCGWLGDANVFARSSAYNYDVKRFFKKWIMNLNIDQSPDGRMSHIVPRLTGANYTACVWSDAVVMVPYTLFNMYGDVSFLSDSYEHMKKYIDYILTNEINEKGIVSDTFQFADWLSLDKDELMTTGARGGTDEYFVANMFFSRVLQIFISSSRILSYDENAKEYTKIYNKHLKSLRDEYITKNGRMASETQTALALALVFNIVEEKYKKDVSKRLDDNIQKHGNHLTTGFAGTPFLLFALTENGYHDTSSKLLLNHTYPSWLYEVDCGATTIWERWNGIMPNGEFFNPAMNSYNHYAYGSVIEFMYRKICGIDYIKDSFESGISIKPHYTKGLYHVKSSFDSIYGEVKVEYIQDKKGVIKNKISIPSNTFALVKLTGKDEMKLGPGKYEFSVKYEDLR